MNPVFQKIGVWYNVLNNNESLNVTNVNSLISLAPGEFRVYANSAAALSTEELLLNDEFSVYPNPIKNTFKINLKVDRLIIYDVNGKKVKEFKGEFEKNHSFETNHLKTGLYFLEVRTKNGKAFKKIVIE